MPKYLLIGGRLEESEPPKVEVETDLPLDTPEQVAQIEMHISFAIVDIQLLPEEASI